MPIHSLNRRIARALFAIAPALIFGGAVPLAAQSLTIGGLTATIVDDHGAPLRDATVTVERGGAAFQTLMSDRLGVVTLAVLTPGRYSVLAEQLGYQPVRMRDVPVIAGGITRVTIRLVRRPPPILAVEDQPSNATFTGSSPFRAVTGPELLRFDRRFDVTGVAEMFSGADVPRDGRDGLVASASGLAPRYSSFMVDGVRESLLRHPGLPGDAATAPLFSRDGVEQVVFTGFGTDAEWPTTLGAILGAQTTRGGERFSLRPWASLSSAKLGGRSIDNPGDSNATSIRAGLSMGGPIKGDTASWFIRADYQQLQTPSASPFPAGIAGVDSGDVAAAIRTAAQALHQDVASWLAPTVRTWKGGSGMGRLDWRFGAATLFAVRAGLASWTEDNPGAGAELMNGAGSRLEARDVSGSASLTTGRLAWTSETRVGVHTTKRDWFGASLPYTGLVGDGVAFGGAATLPGSFSENGFRAYETVTFRAGDHTLKGGGSLEYRTVNYSWLSGSAGRYLFGDLASFQAEQGAFYQAIRTAPAPDLAVTDASLFVEDNWQATPQVQLFAGVRYDRDKLPSNAILFDVPWALASGLRNNLVPVDGKRDRFGPRGGFTWDVSGAGRTIVRANVGLLPGRFDLASLAEAAQFDGNVHVRRATGTLAWPEVGDTTGVEAGQSITMFNAGIRKPRAFKANVSLSEKLDAVTTFVVDGGYHHTDYLLQRQDINRVPAAVATGNDGRPIYGSLQQYGGLITPAVGSNRRFAEFDMVYGLTSSGYADAYELGLSLERQLSRGLGGLLSYTYSKVTDNLPGQLSADPADRLSPFPGGLNGTVWENGRSDLDIPHRVALTLTYVTAGKSPLTVAARYRYRSGLPFTPGFRQGVDANGDGSGGNDPAFIGATIGGMTELTGANACLGSQLNQLAARNSCREAGVHSLDVHAALELPVGGAHHVAVTLDGFNVVGTAAGLFDHAAVLVNAQGTIARDGSGHVMLPLIANPGFGLLLSRRGIPRQLRIGFRVED